MPNDYNRLRVFAEQYQEAMRNKLLDLVKNTVPTPQAQSPAERAGPTVQRSPFGLFVKGGQNITDKDVQDYINLTGGNPYLTRYNEALTRQERGASSNPRVSAMANQNAQNFLPLLLSMSLFNQNGRQDEQDIIRQLIENFSGERTKANEANIARYEEAKGEIGGLRDRNQQRLADLGQADEMLIERTLQENLLNNAADAASRGMGSASLKEALNDRAEFNSLLAKLKLHQDVDTLQSARDTADTNALTGIIERRTDQAPDVGLLANLAMQYGQSGANQPSLLEQVSAMQMLQQMFAPGGGTQSTGYQPRQQLPYYPVYSGGYGGSRGPTFINANQFTGAGDYLAGINQQLATPTAYQQVQQQMRDWHRTPRTSRRGVLPTSASPANPYYEAGYDPRYIA